LRFAASNLHRLKNTQMIKRVSNKIAAKESLASLKEEMIACTKCPRLVEWREKVAQEKVKRFQSDIYWGKPVPSLGKHDAKLFILGLAPAAHGGNRTGRMFTGDRSGDWLYRALHRAGFANQAESVNRADGLQLIDCYISAVAHCAPPDNKPLPQEITNCRPFLQREIEYLSQIRVVVTLGHLAFDTALSLFADHKVAVDPSVLQPSSMPAKLARQRKPKFAHGAESLLSNGITLLASYHPSQQNTFTGRLTEEMLDAVFARARNIIG
jgi:uracil-DNA glycosylase family 4